MKIRWMDKEWVVIGNLEDGGGITTEEDFVDGRASYAHLYPTGDINRHGDVIGSVKDIEVIDADYEPEFTLGTLFGMLTDPSWNGPTEAS